MTDACRALQDTLARGPDDALAVTSAAHLETCAACRARVIDHDRLVRSLRVEPDRLDDVTRARWLARMQPELDAIAARRQPSPRHAPWFAIAAAATIAIAAGWWLVRDRAPSELHAPVVATIDREILRPYVISGASSEAAASTLLAGRFSVLELVTGQLVRATFDRDRDQRIAVVGPARVAVTDATADAVTLDVAGTLLVDARAPAHELRVHAATVTIRAHQAVFAVQSNDHGTLVFVDRGEIELGTTHLGAGDWFGPTEMRSPALVALLREHAHAVPPPSEHNTILAVAGTEPALTQRGDVLGTGPLWARVDPGTVVMEPAASPAPPVLIERPVPAPRSASRAEPLPSPVPAAPTSAELYVLAETALRDGDRATAEKIWLQLLDQYPHSAEAGSARYDLANLVRATDRGRAQHYLAQLLADSPPEALREPARYLSCRLHVEANELEVATTCFEAFRASFADSTHDAEILAWLAGRAEEIGGCPAAHALAAEYQRRYPQGPFSARAATCAVPP